MNTDDKFIRFQQVEDLVGFKRTHIYHMIKDGKFPRPMKIGGASRWSLNVIQEWMRTQVQEAA